MHQSQLQDVFKIANLNLLLPLTKGLRGGKTIPLKKYINTALESCDDSIKTLVVRYTDTQDDLHQKNDFYYDELLKDVDDQCACEPMNAEDPLFILYTSGSTGKPKVYCIQQVVI